MAKINSARLGLTCTAVAIVLVALVVMTAEASSWSFDAYAKSFFSVLDPPAVSTSTFDIQTPPEGLVTNRVRLTGDWRLSRVVRFGASYDLIPQVQDTRSFLSQLELIMIDALSYRVADIDRRLYPGPDDDVGSFALMQNLDRLFVTFAADFGDVYIGRQAIAFGAARVINPTDIIAPFSYETLDTEDRVGVDAVRIRVPLGMLSELDVGYVAGQDFAFDESAQFVRGRLYIQQTDVTFIAIGFRENVLVGFDMARAVGGAGVWLETGYVFVDALDHRGASDQDYLRLSIGADYNLASTLYGFAEYHFNDAGSNDPDDYISVRNMTAYRDGAVYLLGKHYVTPGVVWQITPLITGTAEMLFNMSDLSTFLASSLQYNVHTNIDVGIGFFLGLGDSPANSTRLQSEFGSYPDIAYTSVRIYF